MSKIHKIKREDIVDGKIEHSKVITITQLNTLELVDEILTMMCNEPEKKYQYYLPLGNPLPPTVTRYVDEGLIRILYEQTFYFPCIESDGTYTFIHVANNTVPARCEKTPYILRLLESTKKGNKHVEQKQLGDRPVTNITNHITAKDSVVSTGPDAIIAKDSVVSTGTDANNTIKSKGVISDILSIFSTAWSWFVGWFK